jgi:hypothetical protein
MAATATAISVIFVGDSDRVSENLILHRLLAEYALKLSYLPFELADFRGADDLVIGTNGFTASLGHTTSPCEELARRYPVISS